MKNIKNIVNVSSFVILISFLCFINRFIYHYLKPENKIDLKLCTKLNCNIAWEPTIFLLCLIFFICIMIWSYFIYNPINISFPEYKTISSYEIEKKEHSSMLWGVICYPLILCPLSEDLILFFMTLTIIVLFTFIYLKHLSELFLPPLVIISGEKLYFFKKEKDTFYLLSNKSEKELKDMKNINRKEILTGIYKEISQ